MMGEKKPRNSNSVLKRICRRLFILLLVTGIPTVWIAYSFHIEKVTVVGATRYTPDEIKDDIFQSKLDSNSLCLYLKYKYFADLKIPFVEKIEVEMMDKHSVSITVYEKLVAGCVEFLGEYLYFDKDGIVVETSSKRFEDIPVIKGLKYDKIILHEKFEVQKKELFDVILNITKLINKYELEVDTVGFNSKYEVTLGCGGNKVLLGKKSTYDEALAELKNLLIEAKGMNYEIDMRKFVKGTKAIIARPEE
ncbi:MAG: hypothetical protein K0S76_1821 [Herbinix sp.]|jgi:cell division protein FtsQ|nr:hypothetical protein [Herbinix sp.]